MENPVKYLSFSGSKSMPVILQTEVAECGLACIAMIASYYGHKINLSALRRDYPTSIKGSNVKSLLGLIETLRFSARAVKVELNQLENLQLPFIAHWDLNHFVVVTNVISNKVTINDPAYGKRVLSMAEASKHFTGVAIELLPTKEFEKKDDEISMGLSDLWGRTNGLQKAFIQIFTLSLLLQVFSLINPFFMQIVVDNVIVGNDLDLLTLLSAGFSMLVLIVVCTELLRSYIIMFLGTQLNIQIATNLFRHLLHLPAEFFEKRHIGDVLSRFQSIDEIKDLLTKGLIETVVDGLLVIGTLILMFVYSQLLGTVVLSVVLVYGTIRYIMFTTLQRYTEESIYAEANEKTNFLESVRAFQCIKLFGREAQRQDVWSNQYAKAINADIKVKKYKFTFKAIQNLFFGLENVAVIYLAATLVIDSELSVGMMFAFMAYKVQFSTKSSAVIDKIVEYKMLGLHLSRIADIAMTPQEVAGFKTENKPKPQGELTVENISFQFSPDEPLFLDKANFSFNQGEATAIIGPSGSGKTTLMKIMLGLISPSKGRVLIDGINIHRYGLKNYRSGVAAVMQNDQLLSGTLLDNITFFEPHPDIEHAKECAKLSHIHDDIIDMPMGYDSLIGDMGAALSGGQQQRILLARALYSRPSILFLDEATSHLDPKLESIVSLAIKRLNMTRIIIAHRAETYRSADKIIRLYNGKLKEVKLRQKRTKS